MSYEPETDLMSPDQNDAIEKAYQLLGEHFDSIVIAVNFDYEAKGVGSEISQEARAVYWKGGAMTALGLCQFTTHRILNGPQQQESEP
jgi:hypothetical protein